MLMSLLTKMPRTSAQHISQTLNSVPTRTQGSPRHRIPFKSISKGLNALNDVASICQVLPSAPATGRRSRSPYRPRARALAYRYQPVGRHGPEL